MLFLHNFERFNNLHSYHGRVGGNQLPPISLLLPRMTGRNMQPPVIYFPIWPPLRLRWGHYFRMRDHGSSLFSAVKNLHVPHPFVLTNIHTVNEFKAAVAVSRILRASKHRGYVQPNLLDMQSRLSKLPRRILPSSQCTANRRDAGQARLEFRVCAVRSLRCQNLGCVSSAPTARHIFFRFSLAR